MSRFAALVITVFVLSGFMSVPHGAASEGPSAEPLTIFSYDVPARSPEFLVSLGLEQPPAAAVPQACCKICTVGKACGNTCISRDKQCHVGPGCACDG